jgi:hypothetical protein
MDLRSYKNSQRRTLTRLTELESIQIFAAAAHRR